MMFLTFDNNITKQISLHRYSPNNIYSFIVESKVDMFFVCVDQGGNVYLWKRQPAPDFQYDDWDHNVAGFDLVEFNQRGFVDMGCTSECGDEWLQLCLPVTRKEAEKLFCQNQ